MKSWIVKMTLVRTMKTLHISSAFWAKQFWTLVVSLSGLKGLTQTWETVQILQISRNSWKKWFILALLMNWNYKRNLIVYAHFEARIIPVSDPTLRVEWFLNGQPIKQGMISIISIQAFKEQNRKKEEKYAFDRSYMDKYEF